MGHEKSEPKPKTWLLGETIPEELEAQSVIWGQVMLEKEHMISISEQIVLALAGRDLVSLQERYHPDARAYICRLAT